MKPLERYTQDFLAAIFNRYDLQRVGEKVFDLLLSEAALASVHRDAVLEIRRRWPGRCPSCEIEVAMDGVRPDVVLQDKNLLVAIEIKRRFGIETDVGGKSQSYRLRLGAEQYASKFGISRSEVLVIFLTPDGLKPIDSRVVPVNLTRLCERIERESNFPPDLRKPISSFMYMLTRG